LEYLNLKLRYFYLFYILIIFTWTSRTSNRGTMLYCRFLQAEWRDRKDAEFKLAMDRIIDKF